jgi:uncharacterized damage-inducible protein DinB
MTSAELLADGLDRIRNDVHDAVDGLTPEQLSYRIDGRANSIAWLVWHLTRVQDDHVAAVAQTDQVWTSEGWVDRFGLPFPPSETGYGHRPDEVDAVKVQSGELLTGYYDAVHAQTLKFVVGLTDPDLDRIVDKRWKPSVTLGVRLISVINDDTQHVGQAAFVRGLVERA